MKSGRAELWALVLGALFVFGGAAGAQENTSADPLELPPELDADSTAALGRAQVLMDEWGGESVLLESARVEIERVLEKNPDSAEAHRRYAQYLISDAMRNSSDYDADGLARAEKSLDRALVLDPDDTDAALSRAEVYRLQKRLAEARSELERLDAQGVDSLGVHWNWSELLRKEGKPEEALARCERIRKSGPASRDAADRCSVGPLGALRRLDEVDRLHRAIVEREPTSAWSHGNRASFQLCTRRESMAAVDSASRAIALMNYGHARLTLAAALYYRWAELANAGKLDEADKLWLKAASTMDGDPAQLVAAACHPGLARPVLRALRDSQRTPLLSPVQTVLLAADAAPGWLPGVFGVQVQGSGRGRGREAGYIFLNSEPDYRDPRSVTIRFTPEAAAAYRSRHGADPDVALAGKAILVYGFARQQRIDFTQFDMPTGKYYYQTHIIVTEPDQVTVYDASVLPPRPLPQPGIKA